MISPRTYSVVLIALALAIVGAVSGLAWYLVPLANMREVGAGDLTRVGWYANNRYGNTKSQARFEPALVRTAAALDGRYDVVILGDSFSLDLSKGWANHLAAQGLSVLVIPLAVEQAKDARTDLPAIRAQVAALIDSPAFREHPPGVVIFQSIERMLKHRLVDPAAPCTDAPHGVAPSPRPALPRGTPPAYRIKELPLATGHRYDENQLTYARDFLVNNVRKLFGWKPDVRLYNLRAPRFSSAEHAALLVVMEDLHKSGWSESDLAVMRCQLLEFQQRFQANGRTLFTTLLIPDKLSAYHADLVDSSPPRGVVERLADPGLNRVPVDGPLRAAIGAGDIDVYLPNDTHLGTRGHEITARAVLDFIDSRTVPAKAGR